MGYLQVTPGVIAIGPGNTVSFTTPICPQLAIQVAFSNNVTVVLEISLDGINFQFGGITWASSSSSSGQIRSLTSQNWTPIAAIRYNVTSITGSADISIAAAPSGSE